MTTTGGIIILPIAEPCIANNGSLVVGATLTINIAGSTIASLFADHGLTTPITNPLTSDSAGRFFAQTTVIWSDDSQAYDCILDYNNGTSFTFSNIYTVGPGVDLSSFAPINSPNFTGVPTAPTPATNDNSQKIATTGFVKAQGYAPLNSPALTGVPTAPTASPGTNTTQVATTAFVEAAAGVTAPTGTSSGYFKIGGVILQWTPFSLGAPNGSTQTVSWPIAFPSAVAGTPWLTQTSVPGGYLPSVSSVTTTTALITKSSIDGTARTGTVWAFGS